MYATLGHQMRRFLDDFVDTAGCAQCDGCANEQPSRDGRPSPHTAVLRITAAGTVLSPRLLRRRSLSGRGSPQPVRRFNRTFNAKRQGLTIGIAVKGHHLRHGARTPRLRNLSHPRLASDVRVPPAREANLR